jgi:uncharacterized protein (DUF302 family)
VKALLAILLLALGISAHADELMMARITQPFPEAMQMLQDNIRFRDYTISRVQRVDVGLQSGGFQTAEYRIVFFGRPEEIKKLANEHYELIPYLPLNIVIFAEGDDTLILAASPLKLGEFFKNPALQPYFARWEQDMRSIFNDLKSVDAVMKK